MKPILLAAALAFTLALAVVAGISLNPGGAPAPANALPAPVNVQAAGANPGEVAVSWDAVAQALGWDAEQLSYLRQLLHQEPRVRGLGKLGLRLLPDTGPGAARAGAGLWAVC